MTKADQSARFTHQPAASFNFKPELPVLEAPLDESAHSCRSQRAMLCQPCTATVWLESLIKYVAPPAYIRMSLLLRATGRAAVALKYMHSGGKRGSKSRSELLDCFATCMSEGWNRCRCLSGVGVRLNSCDGRHKCVSGVWRTALHQDLLDFR